MTAVVAIIHAGLAAAWVGGMAYSLFVVQPKVKRYFGPDQEGRETLTAVIASGNRWRVVGLIAAIALTGGGSSGTNKSGSGELRSFVDKVEGFLGQSHDGRLEVAAAVDGAFNCKLTPRVALARLDRVQRNRQSLLQQAAALSVPSTEEALNASDLLQKSVHASFTADGHYSDWLAGRKRCGPPDNSPDLEAARAADKTATRTKRMFVAAFNPLATRLHERVWSANEF